MPARRVTARDVARHAGVSQSTVSYVLNDTPNQTFPETTRAKVRQAARELGYTPSAAARALRRGTSESVLIVLPDAPVGENFARVIESITEVVEPHGYSVVYRRQKDARSLSSLWHELMPAAIANLAAFTIEEREKIEQAGIPVVASSLDIGDPQALSVPQMLVGRMHVKHLVERGHTRIAFAASADPMVGEFLTRRLEGVRAECEERGLPAPIVVAVPLDEDAAARAVSELVEGPDPVTAVSAYNDEVAFAILAGMRCHGLCAPDDLAVIGVDNISLAQFAVPPLTTVDIHADAIGRRVGRLLLGRLKPELALAMAETPEVPVDLVLRRST
ncbi:transcriptional regulator, LacI family [Sanguibacter gelidistatuariae]|uniref:Transcriptional regulator, LacI family n=1 Tax=Sanguibacter gelidistatuariae TaxID=1814289 RepID=A0A1G6UX51_9MICO|nr:LacI family DNA-binding transcriptional regulator [Sanguibacter gelidistatuariae]SDD45195.1 transcriptional regulator, LacI family [Sanguibacter gelidistatuariae]